MNTKELITALADYYEKKPKAWKRGSPPTYGCTCVLDGLYDLAPGVRNGMTRHFAYIAIREQILERQSGGELTIATWNDTYAKDVGEVIYVLRKAAEGHDVLSESGGGNALSDCKSSL